MSDATSIGLRPRRRGVRVSVPARTSISVIDMNQFAPGRAGGGNIGFAIDVRTVASIRVSERDNVATSGAADASVDVLVHHVCNRWRAEVHVDERFCVSIETTPPPHIGLGSSASIQLAMWVGLNWLYGYPFSDVAIRTLVATHYREVLRGALIPGFTTGLSAFLNLYGGFAVVNSSLLPLTHRLLPPWHYAVAVHRSCANVASGETELELLMGRGREYDTAVGERKQLAIARIIRAVGASDLGAMGDAVRDIQQFGSKRAEVMLHGEGLYEVMDRLRAAGIQTAFMSAVGPGLVLLSERVISPAATSVHGLEVLASGRVDNWGLVLETMP